MHSDQCIITRDKNIYYRMVRKVYTARNGARYIKLANGQCRFIKGASKQYQINDKAYVVIVAAENKQGIKFLNQVGYELFLVFVLSVALIAISSYLFSSNI